MGVTRRTRYEVLRRDNYACRYCGASAPATPLTVDHVVPAALGGSDDPSNLVAACDACNSGKAASAPDAPLVADVAADAVRWAHAMRAAAAVQRADWLAERDMLSEFADIWLDWIDGDGDPVLPIDDDMRQTVLNLHRAGLGVEDFRYAVGEAMRARHIPRMRLWRYFAGICWRMAAERRDLAASLVREEAGP